MLEIYSQFRDFHVFRRFKYLLSDWWNIDILVVAKKGDKFFYDDISQLNNPVVKSLLESPLFKGYFLSSLNRAVNKKPAAPRAALQTLPWRQTGLNILALPLILKEAPVSAFIAAAGFAPKKSDRLKEALAYTGCSMRAAEQKINSLKSLSATDEVYMKKMLEILSEEFFKLLQERRKHAKLIEKLNQKGSEAGLGFMAGRSPAMQYIFSALNKIKSYESNVLIEGEKGAGKRLLAQTIYQQSLRAKQPMSIQNFSAVKGKLLEIELFGCAPGAFPHIKNGKKALLQKLDGGTLFLNEIGESSAEFQKKLLKLLKEGRFFSEGAAEPKSINIRVISSSSKDLKKMEEEGRFIKGLYSALSSVVIKIPPLRSRKEDIPLLLEHFLKKKSPDRKKKFSAGALKALNNYSWPGNIRELESEVVKILSLSDKEQTVFTEKALSRHIKGHSVLEELFQPGKQTLKEALHNIEKQILLDCLHKTGWNKTRAAKMLGASRTSIILKIKEYGIVREEAS